MTKNLYVSGCSHVQGHGFPDNSIGSRHSMFAWPAIIERDMDCNVINHSYAGNSIDMVIRNFLDYPEKNKLDAIIILFPYHHRFVVKDQNGIPENFWPDRIDSYKSHRRYHKALNYYLTWLQDDTTTENHFVSQIALVEFLAKKHKVPFWFGVTTDDDKELVEKHLGVKRVFDWCGWCQHYKYNLLPDQSHYDGKAHQNFSGKMKKWLLSQGFENRS